MRLARLLLPAALIAAVTPSALSAQRAARPRCEDGTVSERTGFTACWFHGGVVTPAAARAKPKVKPEAKRTTRPAKAPKVAKATKAAKPAGATTAARASKADATTRTQQLQPRKPAKRRLAAKGPRAPKGATARCMDGSFTSATHRKKACGKHGGVAGWLVPDVPPE